MKGLSLLFHGLLLSSCAVFIGLLLSGCSGGFGYSPADPTERGLTWVAGAIIINAALRIAFNK